MSRSPLIPTEGPFYGVERIGPLADDSYKFTVDGYLVPEIKGWIEKGTEDTWLLVLNERLGLSVPGWLEVCRWLGFVANAMAFAAGFSCFGAHCQPYNPYQRRAFHVTSVATEPGKEKP